MVVKHCLTRIFQPIVNIPKNAKINQEISSRSQRLMLELGIIHQASPGCFHLLPLGLKSLNKLIEIVENEMTKIGGQQVLFPGLINSRLWQQSGRLEMVKEELFTLKDRHNQEYILAPTHEEVASALLSSLPLNSHKYFPLRLYQVSSKFRDEMKPRFGLMRGREFIMKDMYSFDINVEKAQQTYEEVCNAYDNIFKIIGVDFVKVLGDTGIIGGSISHEYQFLTHIGEDTLLHCPVCKFSANIETCTTTDCPQCEQSVKLKTQSGIEVGHTFLLGDRYSKPLKSHFISKDGKPSILQMGSYGLGLGRILAGSVEVLSTVTEMNWPDILAPYNVVILLPKEGSKEEPNKYLADVLYERLENELSFLKNNVLLDDRTHFTVGRRYLDAKRIGYRFIVVINEKSSNDVPLFEFNDTKIKYRDYFTENQLVDYVKQNISII